MAAALFALALVTAGAAAAATLLLPPLDPGLEGLLDLSGYFRFFTFLLMFITIITLLFVRRHSVTHGFAGDELYAFLIFAALGIVLVVAGANWVIFSLAMSPLVWNCVWPVLWTMAILTMAVGNLTALYQTRVKRLLAYSSLAQMGYLLMTLLAVKDGGVKALMFYLTAYAFMDLGAFGIIGTFSGGMTDREEISDYQGLGFTHPWRAATLSVCLLSLAGLPPTAGFMGKLALFRAVLQANFFTLAVLGLVTAIISLYYYMHVVIYLYMQEKGDGAAVPGADLAIGLAGATILWLGLMPEPLLRVISSVVAALSTPG